MGVPPIRPVVLMVLAFLVSSLAVVFTTLGLRSMFIAILLGALYITLYVIYLILVSWYERKHR